MNTFLLSILLLSISGASFAAQNYLALSPTIHKKVSFSTQYSDQGSLIRNVDFPSVQALIPQIEYLYRDLLKARKLKNRGEAHITIVTPPEAKTNFLPNSVGIDKVLPTSEMIDMFRGKMQDTRFGVLCLGAQSNKKGNLVFYLVVASEDILNIRNYIARLVHSKDKSIGFCPTKNFYPHITVGFVGGDVHGVSKGVETCKNPVRYLRH